MSENVHNKLVRDLIPDIIKNNGQACTVSVLDDERYLEELRRKLVEESLEAKGAETPEALTEELADVFEVLDALMNALGVTHSQIEALRNKKANTNGRFDKRLFLQTVTGTEN